MLSYDAEMAFAYGLIIGVLSVLFLTALFSVGPMQHDVGSHQTVCVYIRNDESGNVQACATGEELIEYFRRRETNK